MALGVAVFQRYVGVTIFGIFLTPVFFNVIEWLGHTRLFASPKLHRFSDRLLDIVTVAVHRSLRLAHYRWVRMFPARTWPGGRAAEAGSA